MKKVADNQNIGKGDKKGYQHLMGQCRGTEKSGDVYCVSL